MRELKTKLEQMENRLKRVEQESKNTNVSNSSIGDILSFKD
jgi:DNA-binding protein YbaB